MTSIALRSLLVLAFVASFAIASRPDAASPSDVVTARLPAPAAVRPLGSVAALPVAATPVPTAVVKRHRPERRAARARTAARSGRRVAPARAAAGRPPAAPARTAASPCAGSMLPGCAAPTPVPTPAPRVAAPPVATPTPPPAKRPPRFDSSGGFESEG
jgi:hypothetical protein